MRCLAFIPVALSLATSAPAETVVTTRTIRAFEVISPDAIRLDPATVPGAYTDPSAVIGQEARVAIYPGRAVMEGSIGEPALIDRNQIVELIFSRSGLHIVTEGRALDRASAGERVRVMNLSSRTTLFGTVTESGQVTVAQE
ncbi:flagellar biosynthesis protein FlgA [Salipiger aestuarii]|uniref:Flagella basal body P-ring formation protein FlgA n=1 Tax=Salipiger aestuarii TaxID=568098 RepID=A0A327XV63_9RHOB|nr:flagellar basal body P-ring formation chaperone FlgA [Salipiger aestuarii]EIE52421.1 flagellar basal body P-ring biosynthesis protein FlgA [Citreicella sp. 357]KAA8604340.1 flagellar biosynthesis protein FlgA [Salipiger aestuarii]KAA8606289.1 flagellar biosynthesis protein FlgA [Salipiger aestuarii]KAB2532274.1 flagellar biosynthesis protein FlgA [Salipiger aestuarii]RAK09889.1 flagella basal body P-ring formation protein FlgA [Salipiger aestuarii]